MSIFSELEHNRPDPEFEGLSWYEICERLDEYEHEQYLAQEQWYYENRGWFKDFA